MKTADDQSIGVTVASSEAALAAVRRAQQSLAKWLVSDAYPLWSTRGVDRIHGGFHERVSSGDAPLADPRRARVQPRQVYAFAQSAKLGWQGDAAELVSHGLIYFLSHYRRPDGLFRTLIAPDGAPLDERALLYDQAFALLAFAESHKVLGPRPMLVHEARSLRSAIDQSLKRPGLGFDSGVPAGLPLLSNPHMHLLEASLAWTAVSDDPAWRQLADELATLGLTRFIDPSSGVLREYFDAAWLPVPGFEGRIVEPGHQFEWAWLLLRWGGDRPDVRQAALRLIDLGERHGVRAGVAINALLDDFSIQDEGARLWPQTERVKAAALAARLTGETKYWSMADAAARGLLRYLATPVAGLWYDRLTPQGQFIDEPAPASSFYHIVAAVAELTAALDSAEQRPHPGPLPRVREGVRPHPNPLPQAGEGEEK